MSWNPAELMREARLEGVACNGVRPVAGRAQDFVDDGRHGFVPGLGFRVPGFALQFFLPTFFAFGARPRRPAAGAFPLQEAGTHVRKGRRDGVPCCLRLALRSRDRRFHPFKHLHFWTLHPKLQT